MTKKQRQEVFEKYGGKCAYTGKPLGDDWQVDHVLCRMESYITQKNHDCTDNMLPALRIVNHYKRGLFFDEWRKRISNLHIRLTELPKNPRVEKSKRAKQYMLDVAAAFDITVDKPFNGLFYFEHLKQKDDVDTMHYL